MKGENHLLHSDNYCYLCSMKKILILTLVVAFIFSCSSKPRKYKAAGNIRTESSGVEYGRPYVIFGVKYFPMTSVDRFEQTGLASWYGDKEHGNLTANGEKFDAYGVTAAHKTLPLGSWVEIESIETGRKMNIRINDRGPFIKGRIIDLSIGAAKKLGIYEQGTAKVRIRLLSESPDRYVYRGKDVDLDRGDFAIQVASFSEYANAIKFSKKLPRGTNVVMGRAGDQRVYRVQVAGFKSRSSAEKYAVKLKREYPGAFVVAE